MADVVEWSIGRKARPCPKAQSLAAASTTAESSDGGQPVIVVMLGFVGRKIEIRYSALPKTTTALEDTVTTLHW